jgi:hypothetical protein
MSKKPQPLSPQKRHFSTKRFWLISLAAIVFIIGICAGTSLYDTYRDRPLAKGLDYVGRDYNSGCLPFRILCTGPETEFLFYATEINPVDVVDLFPGWKLDRQAEGLWHLPGGQTDEHAYLLVSTDGANNAAFSHFSHKDRVTSELHLLSTNKPYLIMVDKDEYTALRQIRSD